MFILHYVTCVMCHVSPATCRLSCVTFHMSPVTRQNIKKKTFLIKKINKYIFFIVKKIWQSGGASWGRVFYQRGLPCLVLEQPRFSSPSNAFLLTQSSVIMYFFFSEYQNPHIFWFTTAKQTHKLSQKRVFNIPPVYKSCLCRQGLREAAGGNTLTFGKYWSLPQQHDSLNFVFKTKVCILHDWFLANSCIIPYNSYLLVRKR